MQDFQNSEVGVVVSPVGKRGFFAEGDAEGFPVEFFSSTLLIHLHYPPGHLGEF